ncbi:MAG TPA: TIGR00375 family protein, partial [Armatimonadota bacterium]|nr:TIGR00375 family protein [Armatimonadota bacterium]
MRTYFADLHIHIGRSSDGRAVKVTASRDLTFENICIECVDRKGIEIAGMIDCASPGVLRDIDLLLESGQMVPQPGGGLRYRDRLTVILGSELETREVDGGLSHVLCYFPTVDAIRGFAHALSGYVSNLQLSSQQCHMPANDLALIAVDHGGFVVPAHAFTPHKSLYGSCADRIGRVFGPKALSGIAAIELGLSAD